VQAFGSGVLEAVEELAESPAPDIITEVLEDVGTEGEEDVEKRSDESLVAAKLADSDGAEMCCADENVDMDAVVELSEI